MKFYSTNSLSWENLSYHDGNIRNLHYGLIHSLTRKEIDSKILPSILPGAEPKLATFCKDGDVAFADASEDTKDIAKAIEFNNLENDKAICGLHTIHGRDINEKTIVGFKGFAFNSRYFHQQIRRLAQGSKVFSITAEDLNSCYIYIPEKQIQSFIVSLLNNIEAKCESEIRVLDQYKLQKQYLLQNLFI